MRTLYVKRTNYIEIKKNWGRNGCWPFNNPWEHYYIRCNKKGVVNWLANLPVFTASELIEKNNVKIVTPCH